MAGYLDARPRVGYFYAGKTGNQLLAERLRKMKVGDYKARPVVIREASSVYDAITTLFLEDVGTLYVVNEEGLLAGVVSRKDLLRAALGGKRLEDLPVGVIMTRMPNIITVTPEDSLYDAAKKLIDYEVDSLPVIVEVKEKGPRAFEVVGRVTKTTITRAFVELGQSDR
jgi:Predicted signal-transduction protein containing cAMP-binding and CBS domains